MATKRDENCCLSCGRTWFPRGQDMSDRCPSCKSEDVTFLSLRDETLATREATRQAQLAVDAERRTMAAVRELVEARAHADLSVPFRRADAMFAAACICFVLVGQIVAVFIGRT